MAGEAPQAPQPMPARVAAAVLAGAVVAAAVFAWVLLAGRAELGDPRPTSDFYDEQARAWFDGRWDMDPEVLSIEAFVVDGQHHTYFGPVPALMRVPILAVTSELDGRLAQPSMLIGAGVAMAAAGSLLWRSRVLMAGSDPPGRAELCLFAGWVGLWGAGSVVLVLASHGIVYHEALIWGTAWALWSFAHQISFLAGGRTVSLVWAGVFAGLALSTRASVGAGPVASLAAILGVLVLGALLGGRERRWVSSTLRWLVPSNLLRPAPRLIAVAVAVVVLPVVAYGSVNMVRFGEPFRLPIEKQVFSEIDENRQAALEANDGSLFSVDYIPSTLLAYLRPDAVRFDSLAPWITFPREPSTVVGDATFDTLSDTSSATATMPAAVVLAALGVVVLAGRNPAAQAFRLPVAGAAVGFAGVLVIGFIAHRYLGDLVPLLVVAGAVGLSSLTGLRTGLRRAALAGLAVLGAWSVAANLALAVEHQRIVAPSDLGMRYDFISFQHTLDGHSADPPVRDEVPQPGQRGDLVVIGDCDALLWSNGVSWFVLEGEIEAGQVPPPEQRSTFGEVVATVDEPVREPQLCERLTD